MDGPAMGRIDVRRAVLNIVVKQVVLDGYELEGLEVVVAGKESDEG